jgi:hypothetical protein
VRRLRAGECVAGAGAAGLAVTLFLPWFDVDIPDLPQPAGNGILNLLQTFSRSPEASGWDGLGWVTLAFCVAAIGAGAWLVVATLAARPVAQLVAAAVLTATIGTFAVLVLALRVLVFQPGPNDIVVLRYGAWLGLVAALLVMVGGWWAIKDERTDAPESAYTPPAPRPAPPERS